MQTLERDQVLPQTIFLFFFFFFLYWEFEFRAYTEPLHQPFFVKDFFEVGFLNYLPQSGFELWFSWSLPPEELTL
jgi:hypothetical protein